MERDSSMKQWIYLVSFLLIALAATSCTVTEVQDDGSTPVAKDLHKPPPPAPAKPQDWEWQITKESPPEERPPIPAEGVIPMEFKRPEVALPPPTGEKMDVSITFQSADIAEVMKVLLGELLDVNYVIDRKVGGEFTFRMVGQFYKEEMMNIIQAVLNVHGLAMVKRNGLIEVVILEEAKMEPGPLFTGKRIESKGADIITQVVPLTYITPQNLIPAIKSFMTPAGIAMAPNDARAVVLVDKASNMERLVAMMGTFDVPFFAGRAVKFYDVKNVNVANMAKDLDALANSLGAPPKGPGGSQIGFVPLADSNKLLVAVADPEMLPTIDFWVRNMDTKAPAEAQLYIYKLQHKKAAAMASILNDLFGKESAGRAPIPTEAGTAGPPAPIEPGVPMPPEAGAPAAPTATPSISPAGPVKVIADADSNSLVIKALPQDYQNIRRIIEVMDATPKQVLIEVLIAEVTLDNQLAYGVEYFFRNTQHGRLRDTGAISLQQIPDASRSAFLPGTPPNIAFAEGSKFMLLRKDVDILLNFLDKTTHIEVLSTPRILVRHEQKATIQVGSEEPILTQQAQQLSQVPQGPITTLNTVQYKSIGVILTVTPRIGENNMVTLDVNQEVSSIQPSSGVGGSPRFTTRKANTSLVVENGRTIVLGGIIENRSNKIIRRVPFISSVPLLGNLFKSRDTLRTKTELLLILTPSIVSNPEEADKVTQDFEKKLKAIESLRSRKTTKEKVVVQ